jgi:hypothetical protein
VNEAIRTLARHHGPEAVEIANVQPVQRKSACHSDQPQTVNFLRRIYPNHLVAFLK